MKENCGSQDTGLKLAEVDTSLCTTMEVEAAESRKYGLDEQSAAYNMATDSHIEKLLDRAFDKRSAQRIGVFELDLESHTKRFEELVNRVDEEHSLRAQALENKMNMKLKMIRDDFATELTSMRIALQSEVQSVSNVFASSNGGKLQQRGFKPSLI